MTEAQIQRIEPDPYLARSFLHQARRFLTDGADERNSAESRQVLLHNCAISACDAVLATPARCRAAAHRGHD